MSDAAQATQVLNIFDELIDRVKQARPVRTDGKPLGGGVVYSRLELGLPVDPDDYKKPWAPFGRTADTSSGRSKDASAAAAGPDKDKLASEPGYAREYQAAYKTAKLATLLLQVTDNETYLEYPAGKDLAINYESIIRSMQPGPMPAMDPAVRKQIDDAQKVLFLVGSDGKVQVDQHTDAYDAYLTAQKKYQKARATFAEKQAAAQGDPNLAENWPVISAPYQQDIDDAYQALQALDPSTVEQALDILGSVGISMQDHMIAKARELYDNYQVSLTTLGDKTPYAYILPTGWADPDDNDEGWQDLEFKRTSVSDFSSSSAASGGQFSNSTDHTHTDGNAHGGWFFASASASGGATSDTSSFQGTSYSINRGAFKNTAKNLTVKLSYMLATVYRPYMVADLFYLKNWYTVGCKKNAISDGTVENQKESADPLLPMFWQQMLVIRNVSIHAEDWGDDGQVLDSFYNGDQGGSSSNSSNFSAGGSVGFCGIGFGGSVNHDEAHGHNQGSNWQAKNGSAYFGATFSDNTLTINGAQIVAFLCDIVPACAPMDDPGLAKKDTAATPHAAAA